MRIPADINLVGWVALCLVPRIGGRTLSALLGAFGSPSGVFSAPDEALLDIPLVGPRTVDAIREIDLEHVELQIRQWEAEGITLMGWQDERYPAPLIDLRDRPPLLFAKGALIQEWDRVIAIVGSREPDAASKTLARAIGRELARRGWLIVSGLARGIDAAAHEGALEGGQSVAVLGCGVSNVHPPSSRGIARRMLKSGAIFSEVQPQAGPTPAALMARNRLISGLASAVIVVQAGIHSGSMEAARRARQQGRHVITVDRPEFEGNQALLRMEAIPIPPDLVEWDALSGLVDRLPEPPRQLSMFD